MFASKSASPEANSARLASRANHLVLDTGAPISAAPDTGSTRCLALLSESFGEALAAVDRDGPPSYMLRHADSGRALRVYIVDEADAETQEFEALCRHRTGRGADEQDVPEPGEDGWHLSEGHGDGEIATFPLSLLVKKFATEPARVEATIDAVPGLAVHGTVYEDQLGREITVAFGKNAREKIWTNTTGTLGGFLKVAYHHKVGAKDGKCFITGQAINEKRSRSSIERMFMMGLDIDNGTDLAATIETIKAARLFALVYTTHSHLKPVTDISQSKFHNWAKKEGVTPDYEDLDQVRAYLREVRRYTPEIVESVTGTSERMDEGGVKIFVDHAPIPKFRIMLPLASPYEFQQKNVSHQDTIKSWGRKIFGMANALGLTIDTACVDPSRLFYGPRHLEGRAFEVHLIGGEFLDISKVAEGESIDQSDPFAAAGAEMAGATERDETYRYIKSTGLDLWKWSGTRGLGFEAANAIKDHAPAEFIRYENAADRKLIVKCPFDDQHSNPGDDADVACMVMNASDLDDATGFKFSCRHESCQGFWKNDFICKAVELGYLPAETLSDENYNSVDLDPGDAGSSDRQDWCLRAERSAELPLGYFFRGAKLMHATEGDQPQVTELCDAFEVIGFSHDENGEDWCLVVNLRNLRGQEHEVRVPQASLQANPSEVRKELANKGLRIDGAKRAKDLLDICLTRLSSQRIIQTVTRPGWHKDQNEEAFVTPLGIAIGASGEIGDMRLASDAGATDKAVKGTMEEWRAAANTAMRLNPHWGLGLCVAFAGPIVELLNLPSLLINLSGPSSRGKSTAQMLAASGWANPEHGEGLMHLGSTTINATENLLVRSSGTTFLLDEAGLTSPDHVGPLVFSIVGETGKSRQRVDGTLRRTRSWSTCGLVSSERPLGDIVRGAGGKWLPGQAVRAPDVDISSGTRAVNEAEMEAVNACRHNYGHAGPAFVQGLFAIGAVRHPEMLARRIQGYATALAGDMSEPIVRRAADTFAVLRCAGEIARESGVLDGDVEAAIAWAWNAFRTSPQAEALDPKRRIVEALAHYVATHRNVDVVPLLREIGASRPIKAWYGNELLYVPTVNLASMVGGVDTMDAILNALESVDLLKRPSASKRVYGRIPEIGMKSSHVRICLDGLVGKLE